MSAGSARENGTNDEDMEKEGEKEEQEGGKERGEEEEEKEREGEKEREEEGGEKENEGKEREEENKKQKQKQGQEEEDLFRLVVVNSYGSQEVQRLKDDDSIPLKLGSEWMCVCERWRGGLDYWSSYFLPCCSLRSDVHCV